nr:uncharacterized protein LOC104115550 [Nicotiana tomentosiformis]
MAFSSHTVSRDGIKANTKKIEEVHLWPRPSTTTEIRSFFGLVGFYCRFMEEFSSITAPLTKLTQKDSGPYMVYCDASRIGLGIVSMHDSRVIDYASRQLKPYEKNYPIPDLWLAAIKEESMSSLAFIPTKDRPFAIDVQAMSNRFKRLNIFEPSRVLACVTTHPSLFERIKAHQYDDIHLLVLMDRVLCGGDKEAVIGDDGVFRIQGRICVPNIDGSTKMYRNLKQHYWWRRVKKDIFGHVSQCLNCQRVKDEHQRPEELVRDALEKVKLILDRLLRTQSRTKIYAYRKVRDMAFIEGSKVEVERDCISESQVERSTSEGSDLGDMICEKISHLFGIPNSWLHLGRFDGTVSFTFGSLSYKSCPRWLLCDAERGSDHRVEELASEDFTLRIPGSRVAFAEG